MIGRQVTDAEIADLAEAYRLYVERERFPFAAVFADRYGVPRSLITSHPAFALARKRSKEKLGIK